MELSALPGTAGGSAGGDRVVREGLSEKAHEK